MESSVVPSIGLAGLPAKGPKGPLPHVIIPHYSEDGAHTLRPWIVHVFQGKPSHQNDDETTNVASNQSSTADAASSPSAAVTLSLPSTSDSSLVAPPPANLPFEAPTTKEAHDSHDLTVLSPEQAAFYANEYGKVEQQLEMAAVLDSLRYRLSSNDTELRRVCERVEFHQVSVKNVSRIVQQLQEAQQKLDEAHRISATPWLVPTIVVLNLCDGTETDHYPGVSIARALQRTWPNLRLSASTAAASSSTNASLPPLFHTGADPDFFATTTDKVTMKQIFDDSSISHAHYRDLTTIDVETPVTEQSCQAGGAHHALFNTLQESPQFTYPLIIKPTTSYSSCGLSKDSVVLTPLAALIQAQKIKKELGSVLAEEYIQGREFSLLIVGDWNTSTAGSMTSTSTSSDNLFPHLRCYPAAERAFDKELSPLHQFLTFEQNYPTQFTKIQTWWQGMDATNGENSSAPARLTEEQKKEQRELANAASAAYVSCKGRSYGRIDVRQRASTGKFYILEVNSLPGLSGELDSSVGAILAMAKPKTNFAEFLYSILHLAVHQKLDRTNQDSQ